MNMLSLFCIWSCVVLVITNASPAVVPDRTPQKNKDTEVKDLITELKALRQRLDEVEKRLGELNSVPVLVGMSEPYEVVKGGPGLPVSIGHGGAMRRDNFARFYLSLSTDEKKSKLVTVRETLQNQPFRFEVEIPHEDAKQPPLRVPVLANESLDSHEMKGFIWVPKEARLGHDVQIKISWPAQGRIAQGSITKRISILPAK